METKKMATIEYLLDEEGRRKSLLTGGNGEMLQHIEVEANDRIINLSHVSEEGIITLCIGFGHSEYDNKLISVVTKYKIHEDRYDHKYELGEEETHCYFSSLMTVEELLDWEEKRRSLIEKQKQEFQPIIDKHNEEIKLMESEKAKKEEEEQELRHKENEQKQKELEEKKRIQQERANKNRLEFEDQRNNWIEQFGSQYLKDAVALGYDIDDKYIEERASKEFPDYEIDFNDNAGWTSRSNPSEAAINEVRQLVKKGYDTEIVWLTNPVNEDKYEYEDSFKECEAIAIIKYLGKYDLVKEI